MSAPSSLRELALVAVALGAGAALAGGCGSGSKGPQGDPAKFEAVAKTMLSNVPVPGGAPECTGEQVLGGATMMVRTLLHITKQKYEDTPESRDFVNPPELEAPAVRVLADAKASDKDRRRAAGELAAAPFYLAYIIDHVDVPMALGFKELKLGIASGRALRYDKQGNLQCVRVFHWHNDEQVSADAIAKSDKAVIAPAISQMLQDDLKAQLLKRIGALGAPPPAAREMAKKPKDH